MKKRFLWLVPTALLATMVSGTASAGDETVSVMAKATKAFLDTLKPADRARTEFPFNSEERLNWHYIPKDRNGLSLREMNKRQREAALKLLRTGLSESGYKKVTLIRDLESVLQQLEGPGRRFSRDPNLYHFSIFGTPSATGTWGWRYEGHHCSLNFTIVDGKVVTGDPQFFGANPAKVLAGRLEGTRALAPEEDLARALVKSLSASQKQQAILNPVAPPEILTRADRKATMLDDKGIRYRDLEDEQQGMLLSLIRIYADALPAALAERRLAAIRQAGMDTVRFAWMGPVASGEGQYYRVQGKTFLIEYDNTQNDANHIHAVWRDFKGDFGLDLLALHYQLYPHRFARSNRETDVHNSVAGQETVSAQEIGNSALRNRLLVFSGQGR